MTSNTPPTGESAPPSLEEGGTGAGHSAVLPDARWWALNDRWHPGAKLTAEEFGALLDLALEYHLNARRLLQERDAAEARAARAEDLVSLLVPDLLEDMAESIERRQPDLYGYTNEHGGTVSIALYLCGLADRVRALTEGADQ